MLPHLLLVSVAALLAAVSKILTAGADRSAQETAALEAAEAMKKVLDHFKFGGDGGG